MRFFYLAVLLTVSLTVSFTAQTPTPAAKADPAEDEIIKVNSRLIVVPVSVTDASGQPVLGLKAEDFRIAEEKRPQVIEAVGTADVVPLEIALLFDVSATTSPMFKFQQETAGKFLKEVLRPNDRATLFTVGTQPRLVHPRDSVENAVAALSSIQPSKGSTAFFDTVRLAAEYLRTNAPSGTRRVLVVISDGEDTNSSTVAKAIQDGYKKVGEKINTIDNKSLHALTVKNRDAASARERVNVSKALQNADTVFYSINPAGSSYQLNKMSVYGQTNMQMFADETGGTAFLPKFQPIDTRDGYQNSGNMRRNTELLDKIFNQLANELRSQYLIQYYSESEYPANKFVTLDVAVPTNAQSRIRARRGYYVGTTSD
jgi:Ca-activated chloride channel family protein